MMLYDAEKKSLLVAFLLWAFLGHFGAHRFYAGRVATGVAMLVIELVSIPLMAVLVGYVGILIVFVWWLVDAFRLSGWIRGHNVRLAYSL